MNDKDQLVSDEEIDDIAEYDHTELFDRKSMASVQVQDELKFEKSRLEKFSHELKLLFVELNIVTQWISENFGVELINKTSEEFKHMHDAADVEPLTQALSLLKKRDIRRSNRRRLATITPVISSAPRITSKRKKGRPKNILIRSDSEPEDPLQDPLALDSMVNDVSHVQKQVTREKRKRKRSKSMQDEIENGYEVKKTDVEVKVDGCAGNENFSNDNHISESTTKKKYIWKPSTQVMQCEECGKILKGDSSLRCHMLMHADFRPHECSECGKRFRNKTKLGQHALIHNAEKSEKCTFCGRGFLRKKDLIIHERTHTGEKPFNCLHCSKSFNIKEHLTIHLRVHTGERPYKCEVCMKTFSQANSLRIHRKIHLKSSGGMLGNVKKPREARKRKRQNQDDSVEAEKELPYWSDQVSNLKTTEEGISHNTVNLQTNNHSHSIDSSANSNSKLSKSSDYQQHEEEHSQSSQTGPKLLQQGTQTKQHQFPAHVQNNVGPIIPEHHHSLLVQSFFQPQQGMEHPCNFTGTTSSVANPPQNDHQRCTIHQPHTLSGFKLQQVYSPQQNLSRTTTGLILGQTSHNNQLNGPGHFGIPQFHDTTQGFRHFPH